MDSQCFVAPVIFERLSLQSRAAGGQKKTVVWWCATATAKATQHAMKQTFGLVSEFESAEALMRPQARHSWLLLYKAGVEQEV